MASAVSRPCGGKESEAEQPLLEPAEQHKDLAGISDKDPNPQHLQTGPSYCNNVLGTHIPGSGLHPCEA